MSSANNIFNVSEPTGKDQVALETTAAQARSTASNSAVAHEVEKNANREHDAAEHAASIAKTLGPNYTGEPTTAVNDFKTNASRTANAAVAEGKHDVEEVKAASVGYVEQARVLAASAIGTAQSYLPTAIGGGAAPVEKATATAEKAAAQASQQGQGILATVEATAESVYNKVAATVQPQVERVKEVVQPHVENVKGVAQEYVGTAGVQGADTGSKLKPASEHNIPKSTAPLESGANTVDTPYPPYSSVVKGEEVAASGAQRTAHN